VRFSRSVDSQILVFSPKARCAVQLQVLGQLLISGKQSCRNQAPYLSSSLPRLCCSHLFFSTPSAPWCISRWQLGQTAPTHRG
jgi:hypothetical protein